MPGCLDSLVPFPAALARLRRGRATAEVVYSAGRGVMVLFEHEAERDEVLPAQCAILGSLTLRSCSPRSALHVVLDRALDVYPDSNLCLQQILGLV